VNHHSKDEIELDEEAPWEIPSSWVWTKLLSAGNWSSGGTPSRKSAANYGGEIPWTKIGDLNDGPLSQTEEKITEIGLRSSSAKIVPPETLLVAMYGASIGKLAITKISCTTNQAIACCQTHQGIKPELAFNYLRLQKNGLVKLGQGGAQPNISQDILKSFPFPIPPSTEQARIVSKIDELFSRIEAGEKALQRAKILVERFRKSVLKAAVTGELTREWREKNKDKIEPASKLLERILKSRREAWEKSELAKVKAKGKKPMDDAWKKKYVEPVAPDQTNLLDLPEGWVWVNWGSVGWSQNGRPFPSSEYQDHGVKLLRPGNLFADGSVRWTKGNTRCLPLRHEVGNPDLIIGPQELVINLTAQSLKDDFLGRVCITQDEEHCLLNQRLARLTPILIDPRFMLIVFRSPLFRECVLELNTGSLIQHMFTSQIEKFSFPLPPLAEQELIIARVGSCLESTAQLSLATELERESVGQLKQSILSAAFEGKLVPQDPSDEPASILLERIRAATAAPKPPISRKAKR
jgi:type I restriction enzyme, S subunit